MKKHKKSKNSCLLCKKRRIKCDIRVPECSNCERRGIECPFLKMTPYQNYIIAQNEKKVANIKFDANINLNHIDEKYNVFEYDDLTNHSIDLNNIYNTKNTKNTNTANTNIQNISSLLNPLPNKIKPLYSNSKISNLSFKIDNLKLFQYLDLIIDKFLNLQNSLTGNDLILRNKLLSNNLVDYQLYSRFINLLSITQIFNKIVRKSLFLYSFDYYKNILLKQFILKNLNCRKKLSISLICEINSFNFIEQIRNLIKNDYNNIIGSNSIGKIDNLIATFLILDDCLIYHFKNGLNFDINLIQSNNAINLIGIFSTNVFSILISQNSNNNLLLLSCSNIISSYIISYFKNILIKNYYIGIFDEFKSIVDNSLNFFNSNNSSNFINYENLKFFCEKYSSLLKENVLPNTLLGYNNGFIIRIFNSFKSIYPFDLSNLNSLSSSINELDIILGLFYSTLNQILSVLIPGKNLVCGLFSETELDIFNLSNLSNLMKLFNKINSKKLKLLAIYLIRSGLYFKCHCLYYKSYLSSFTLNQLFDFENDLSIHNKYLRLKKFKFGGVADEIHLKYFNLKKGQFIKRLNYPNYSGLKRKRDDKISDNKISNYFKLNDNNNNNDDSDNDLINDFINTNTGFLSMDYNPLNDIEITKSITEQTKPIDKLQIEMLWKLSTYICSNNL
ncbi:hypothetical protein C6P42_004810 [Pichia californica]|nr:hypothetical protein C6P42_004810 [[Candida] californica]